jgi:hypothetical protein
MAAKVSYRDMAVKPVEFPNLKELKADLERLSKENADLRVQISCLEHELREARGEVFYERSARVRNLHIPSLAPVRPLLPCSTRWGDEDEDESLNEPDSSGFTDEPNDW